MAPRRIVPAMIALLLSAGCSSTPRPPGASPGASPSAAPSGPAATAPGSAAAPGAAATPTTAAPAPATGPGPAAVSSAHPCAGTAPPATWDHVVWIVMENRAYSEVVGSPSAPYLATLAARCGLATDYSGVAHPSLPNYIAMTSGSTQGVGDDSGPGSHPLAARSIFGLLGPGWRALAESMPRPCDHSSSGNYATKHNPAVYYTSLAGCPAQDVPMGAVPDVSARFTFITPDLCNDMHDCSTATGDRWLSRVVPRILDSSQYRAGRTALFVTWDENDSGGSRVATYVVAPSVPPGVRPGTPLDHYSLLRATEQMLGLTPLLGRAATASDMRGPFHL